MKNLNYYSYNSYWLIKTVNSINFATFAPHKKRIVLHAEN